MLNSVQTYLLLEVEAVQHNPPLQVDEEGPAVHVQHQQQPPVVGRREEAYLLAALERQHRGAVVHQVYQQLQREGKGQKQKLNVRRFECSI